MLVSLHEPSFLLFQTFLAHHLGMEHGGQSKGQCPVYIGQQAQEGGFKHDLVVSEKVCDVYSLGSPY